MVSCEVRFARNRRGAVWSVLSRDRDDGSSFAAARRPQRQHRDDEEKPSRVFSDQADDEQRADEFLEARRGHKDLQAGRWALSGTPG